MSFTGTLVAFHGQSAMDAVAFHWRSPANTGSLPTECSHLVAEQLCSHYLVLTDTPDVYVAVVELPIRQLSDWQQESSQLST